MSIKFNPITGNLEIVADAPAEGSTSWEVIDW